MSSIQVRLATLEDRAQILAISSQIWDGEDYVSELLDGWFADSEGELVVATLDRNVIAFAHRTWLSSGIAWLEGIRADPAFKGRGAGRAITEYLICSAREAGATHIELSTYIDNEASIHIIESYGFQLVGTFSYLERPAGSAPTEIPEDSSSIRTISDPEAVDFIAASEFLALAQRRFPRGWRFFPFDDDPRKAIERLECRLAFWSAKQPTAVMCIRQGPEHEGSITINYLDGEPAAVRALLNQALRLYAGKTLQIMVPIHQGKHAAALELLQEAGFESWSDFKPDVFAYELVL
ncbi:GNAT family N-acetyltransferase [Candidatus Bipolaricaulota bacterium]